MKTYRKVWSYLPGMRWLLVMGVVCSTLSAFATVYGYYNINLFFRQLLFEGKAGRADFFARVIVLSFVIGFAIYFLGVLLTHVAAFHLETVLRKRGIKGLEKAGFSFFDHHPSGEVRKIIDDNAAQTHMAVAHLIPDITSALIIPVCILALGYVVNLKVGIILTLVMVLSFILTYRMMGDSYFLEEYQKYNDRMGTHTVEYVRGIQVVKIFGGSIESFKSFYRTIQDYSKLALRYSMSCKWPYTLFQLLFFALMVVVIPVYLAAGNFGVSAAETAVELVMLTFLSGVFFVSFMKVMYMGMNIRIANLAIEKLESLYSLMAESEPVYGNRTEFKNFDIEFSDVSFSYGSNEVLSHFSLSLKQGGVYAFIGGSGSGKSTIAKLIAGFYPVSGGTVKIGGEDIHSYSEEAFMKQIAVVFQNPRLFKTSIFENVKIGNPSASRAQVMRAIKRAGCDEILDKFPDRENTLIGSKGVYLSGGEKQRITIARALLKDAQIIILDEASGAVDPDNEYKFQQAFSNLIKGKTVIMIAHRLSSIRGVDRIFVMEDGKVVESGSDSTLMSRDSRYRYFQDLYRSTTEWRVEND